MRGDNNIKFFIKGKGSIEINKGDFVNSGGFGDIYTKAGTAYKIYQNHNNMIPEAKIRELSVLKNSNIIKPENVLIDNNNKPVGYTMKFVNDTYALCQIFPKPFRARNNIKSDTIIKLVRRMQETISAIHAEKILIVDLNEMNFLVDKFFKEVYFIDVDSYQTHSFPANALMESVRDRHAARFDERSDWFSFAVVSYQMFRGIHPYKGKHPKYPSLDDRMINNISIHNPDVGYPTGAVLPIDVIPQVYQDWYKAVLDDGKRIEPPAGLVSIIHVVTPQVKTLSGKLFDVIELNMFSRKAIDGDVIKLYRSGNNLICLTSTKVYNEKGFEAKADANMAIGFTSKKDIPVGFSIDESTKSIIGCRLDTGEAIQTLPSVFKAESIMDYNGNIFYKNGPHIFLLNLFDGVKLHLTSSIVANVMENATKLFPGCAIQHMLGTYYVNIFPDDKRTFQFKLLELNRSKVVAAKYDNHVLMVVVSQEGKYNRYIFVFDEKYNTYNVRVIKDIIYTGLNFVSLPQGICVCVNEDESIDIFSLVSPNNVKNLKDDSLQHVDLIKNDTKVSFSQNGKFFQLKMK